MPQRFPVGPLAYLIYDADCGFCTKSARWIALGDRVAVKPWQALDLAALGLTTEQVTSAAYWVEDGSAHSGGAAAISRALTARGGWTRPLGGLIALWPVKLLAARIYAIAARNRFAMPGGTVACRVPK